MSLKSGETMAPLAPPGNTAMALNVGIVFAWFNRAVQKLRAIYESRQLII